MTTAGGNLTYSDLLPSIDQAFQNYHGMVEDTPITTYGLNTLRGGKRTYSPCVLDRNEWENFYQTLPVDYDIKNDRCFDLHRSAYNRLMDVGAKPPETTTSEMLRTGYCGPDDHSYTRPGFIQQQDRRPEPAYRTHLSDRTALHFLRADPLEGVLPYSRQGDMCKSKGTTHRDFKWRALCWDVRPKHQTMDREVYRFTKTDLHGREHLDKVVKFDDDCKENYFQNRLIKLKKAWYWPINPITREPLGGSLSYYMHDPCRPNREAIWPCGEKNYLQDCPIRIPNDRCRILAHGPKDVPRVRDRHFNGQSYLDMRYPVRNYECWEEVPRGNCAKPEDFPCECTFPNIQPPPPAEGAQAGQCGGCR